MRILVVVLSVATIANGNMYDVIETHKVPGAKCKAGCAPWTDYSSAVWASGKVPKDAGSVCAQPGAAVNDYTYGAWCRCAKTPSPSPSPSPSPPNDPDHPLNGSTFLLYNTYPGQFEGKYVSFAFSDAPSGEPAGTKGCNWLRVTYASQSDAMPIRFVGVDGQKDVYTLFNDWGDSEYQKYLRTDPQHTNYISSCASTPTDAMRVRVIPSSSSSMSSSTYVMTDVASGNYVSYTNDGGWLRADYSDLTEAMTMELVPKGAQPSDDWDYCTSDAHVPEQINVQIASPTSVVVSFVTFPSSSSKSSSVANDTAPFVRIGESADKLKQVVRGVTHTHTTAAGDRTYLMHFVRISDLDAHTRYYYAVSDGTDGAPTSDVFNFRSMPKIGDKTVVAIYGDMGVYTWNNMGNLDDEVSRESLDLVVHLGDHAYNEGDDDERRADGYMTAFEKVIGNIPWMPVVGNHEYYSGAELGRYMDQTWEQYGPTIPGANVTSTATSAIGAFLSRGNYHAAGTRGSLPSNSSRYFSVDVGSIHFIALDLNFYYGVDPCGDPCRQAQLDWLEEDLARANANRESVPWVVATSHYPFYCTGCYSKQVTGAFYASPDAEIFGNANRTASDRFFAASESTTRTKTFVAEGSEASIADIVPVLNRHGVDLYVAGHWHYYESLWPSVQGKTGVGGDPLQKTFTNPNVTVHVTSGNGGPPSADSFDEDCPGPDCGSIPSTRKQSVAYGYGRLTAFNASHLQFEQISNADGSLVDAWVLEKSGAAY